MISMDKRYRTRDGREVLLYAIHDCGPKPVHGAFKTDSGYWGHMCWAVNGHTTDDGCNRTFDLIEVKPKITRTYWLVHPKQGKQSVIFFDDKEALHYARGFTSGYSSLTGPHTVEFTEGENLG